MAFRYTNKHLESLCLSINKATDSPIETYVSAGKANIGNYHLSFAYGGVCLERIVSEGGATTNVFGFGYVTKRELYAMMSAYLIGINKGKRQH